MDTSGESSRHDPVQFVARIMTYVPLILLKSGGAWLSFKRQAKKGGKAFRKELINQGLDKEMAAQFTEQYLSGSNLVKILLDRS